MTITKHEAAVQAQITADPHVPLIRIVREFDAPPAKVFRAHVDPELVVRWTGPNDMTTELETWDCRTGGSFRYLMRRDGEEQAFRGCFHHVWPGEEIVQTFTWEGQPDGVALERLVFEDLGDGRTRLVATSLVDSFEGRDMWLASGMETGVNEGYARLDAILAAGA
jgi:uncharacterized protein YndB with AHSA1/START domain